MFSTGFSCWINCLFCLILADSLRSSLICLLNPPLFEGQSPLVPRINCLGSSL
ncbi:unnamed protein product [Moneuplotes crassus]|uniref:Uncharacterized protein n=1 Tax=Euplotes crassus TaxID=5936 RepID=A0AAD1YAY5_EUPCR|nr:unnamed protein product [Moneuplotes crassus]